jgi:hypothetical protein
MVWRERRWRLTLPIPSTTSGMCLKLFFCIQKRRRIAYGCGARNKQTR